MKTDRSQITGARPGVGNKLQRVIAERENNVPFVVCEPVGELGALGDIIVKAQQFLPIIRLRHPPSHIVAARADEIRQRVGFQQRRPVL